MVKKLGKLEWENITSIKAPLSVVGQLDEFKKKHGYTSRPQALVALIEKVHQIEMRENFEDIIQKVSEKERGKIAEEVIKKFSESLMKQ